MNIAKKTTHRLTTGRLLLLGIGAAILIIVTMRLAVDRNSDVLGMAVGMAFGILAGLPAALLILATSARRSELEREEDECYERYNPAPAQPLPTYPFPPPVVEPEPTWTPPSKHEQAKMAEAAARTIAERLIAGDRDTEALDRIALDNYLCEAGSRILFLRDFGVQESLIAWWMGGKEYACGLKDVEHYHFWQRIYTGPPLSGADASL